MQTYEVSYKLGGFHYVKHITASSQADALMSILTMTSDDGIHVSRYLGFVKINPKW